MELFLPKTRDLLLILGVSRYDCLSVWPFESGDVVACTDSHRDWVGLQCTACVAYAKRTSKGLSCAKAAFAHSFGTRSKRMHWMDARALRRKDAFRGERPWGDTVCDPWISDRETVSKLRG
ncbi:hypothetical protein VNO77_50725 [Canavalia gladiata]|uniref:Uncharacterized protein n=1 Tax=Canavalia gladiata TaxID=3824 RepID=A0AAN9PEJ3_CANGL